MSLNFIHFSLHFPQNSDLTQLYYEKCYTFSADLHFKNRTHQIDN